MLFIGVEVEQETSAPPPKIILDPPLLHLIVSINLFTGKMYGHLWTYPDRIGLPHKYQTREYVICVYITLSRLPCGKHYWRLVV